MGEQNESKATCGMADSWELTVRYEDDRAVAELRCFGTLISVTTLGFDGAVTVQEA
ncbi:hypothetical protein [Streptomyces sp. NPDC056817]|uniref:hypothetical protein n=1 Tax=Streptomyces sp. NPDC056817 TaxID=3345950 RepID=UPI003686980F